MISHIQKALKVGKSNRNEFGKYNYRNCSDILEAVKPLLPENWYVHLTDDLVLIGERYYVKATATLSDGKTSFSSSAFARESYDKKGMDDSQITGAASSYARKYALNALLAIDDTTDADGMDNSSHTTKKEVKKISDSQRSRLVDMMDATKTNMDKFCSAFGFSSLDDMPIDQYDKAVSMLNKKLEQQNGK